MYRFSQNGRVLATVSKPTWIRLLENGSFGLTDEATAQGVVLDGKVYHLTGAAQIEGAESVELSEIDEATYQREQAELAAAQNLQTETALAELSILIATMGGNVNV